MTENDLHIITLQNTLNEMLNTCKDIRHAFIFNTTGKIVVKDQETKDEAIIRARDSLNNIAGKAETIGGIEAVTLKCSGGTMILHSFGEHYFVAITTRKADLNYIKTLTRIIISTVLQVIEKVSPTPIKNTSSELLRPQPRETQKETQVVKLQALEKPEKEQLSEFETTSESIAIQLIVENVEGLLAKGPLAHSDTVRIDKETLAGWKNMLDGKEIEYVEIEALNGKTAKCKVKPIKDSKYLGKGMVQIPKKTQLILETKKGEPVKVRPLID